MEDLLREEELLNHNDQAFPWTSVEELPGFWFNGRWVPVFAGGDGENDDSQSDDKSGDGDDGQEDTSKGDDGQEDKSKGKTFTQEEVNAIAAREAQKAKRGRVNPKDYGFDSQKELDEFLKSAKQKEEESKSEHEKAVEEAKRAGRKEAEDQLKPTARNRLIKADFKVAAHEAGIPKANLEDAFLLAQQLEEYDPQVDDDKDLVEGFDDDFFKALKEKKSFLFGKSDDDEGEEGKGGKEGEKSRPGPGPIGAGAGGNNKGKISSEDQAIVDQYPAMQNVQ